MKNLVCESLNEFQSEKDGLELLREQYPQLTFNMNPHPRFKDAWLCNVYEGENYLAGVKGPCSYEQGVDFFKNVAQKHEEGTI
jgi:hypothetical protein